MSQQNRDITEIDKNLAAETLNGREIVWYDVDEAPFRLYGLMRTDDGARYCRMPEQVAKNPAINAGVRSLYTNTSGGRVRFSTDSPYIAVKCEFNVRTVFSHMPATGVRGFDLIVNTEHDNVYCRTFTPDLDGRNGYVSMITHHSLEGMHSFTLNFPLYNNVDRVWIGLSPEARLEKGKEYRYQKPAVFYGSSITQGGCASRPGNCYTNLISQWLDMDYINLGFSGSGKAEVEMMEYLASLDMSMFIYDYDHNAPSVDYLKETHERGFRIVREKHPELPVIFVTKPDWRPDSTASTQRRRDVIFHTYAKALAEGDRNIAFVDGRSFFAKRAGTDCTVDGCHPNDLGMFRMAEGIGDAMELFLRKFR